MRYWIGVASKDHVSRGVAGGFSQLCHGKAQPLKRMAVGDWLIYYSPKEVFEEKTLCQKFTAIGEVVGSAVYKVEMFPGFSPYRRDICFHPATETPIKPLLEQLSFIKDKSKWGYMFRFGHLEIPKADFELIAAAMLGIAKFPVHSDLA
jgi:predicted RNA-binding protein